MPETSKPGPIEWQRVGQELGIILPVKNISLYSQAEYLDLILKLFPISNGVCAHTQPSPE